MLNDTIFLEHVRIGGDRFRELLKRSLPNGCAVDGRGMCTVIDLTSFRHESVDVAWRWVCQLREQGLLVHLTGAHRERVAILPPLNVDEDTLRYVASILSESLEKELGSGQNVT